MALHHRVAVHHPTPSENVLPKFLRRHVTARSPELCLTALGNRAARRAVNRSSSACPSPSEPSKCSAFSLSGRPPTCARGPHACSRRNSSRAERRRDRRDAARRPNTCPRQRRHMRAGSPPPPPRPLSASFPARVRPPRATAATTSSQRTLTFSASRAAVAGGQQPSNEPTVSCWLDEAASEEASKDARVCVHTHPCLDYEDDDKAPHAEDSW